MNKSKLVQLIKTLSPSEQHSLLQFLESPFFNQREDVLALAIGIQEGLRQLPPKLDKTQIWRRVYGKKVYRDQQMRLLMSYLYKLLEQFISLTYFQADQQARELSLVKAYRERGLDKQFRRVLNRGERLLQAQSRKDRRTLYDLYELKYEQYLHLANKKPDQGVALQELNDLLDQQFIYEKLQQTCIFYARNAILDESHQPTFLEHIIVYLEADPKLLEVVGIKLYYQLYQLLRSGRKTSPDAFLDWLRRHDHHFSPAEMGHVYRLLINYCIRQMNAGETIYIQRTFDLYREGVEKGFLLEKGAISAFTYINMMLSGLKLGAFDWVEVFLDQYRKHLKTVERDNIYYFCLAHLRYEQDRLAEAMKLLVRFGAKQDSFLYLSAQTTLVKIYFQLREFDPLESLLQRMQVYINRKGNIGYRKAPYKKLMSVCRKMIHLAPNDRERRAQLRREADQITIPSFREWVITQLEDA